MAVRVRRERGRCLLEHSTTISQHAAQLAPTVSDPLPPHRSRIRSRIRQHCCPIRTRNLQLDNLTQPGSNPRNIRNLSKQRLRRPRHSTTNLHNPVRGSRRRNKLCHHTSKLPLLLVKVQRQSRRTIRVVIDQTGHSLQQRQPLRLRPARQPRKQLPARTRSSPRQKLQRRPRLTRRRHPSQPAQEEPTPQPQHDQQHAAYRP